MRVLLADDHRLMLDAVRRALEADGGFEIVGETEDGSEVLGLVGSTEPDVVLLDVRIPNVDGLTCLDEIRRNHPGVEVVMLSASSAPEILSAARRRGAAGYVSKTIDPRELPAALRRTLETDGWTEELADSEQVAQRRGDHHSVQDLTQRESTILGALARGLSNAEIAKELWVTEQTVKFHLTNIYRKLGARSRTDAVRRGYEHGLIERPLSTGD
jgi:DNA-binding NarL/FixJ family response regulator